MAPLTGAKRGRFDPTWTAALDAFSKFPCGEFRNLSKFLTFDKGDVLCWTMHSQQSNTEELYLRKTREVLQLFERSIEYFWDICFSVGVRSFSSSFDRI